VLKFLLHLTPLARNWLVFGVRECLPLSEATIATATTTVVTGFGPFYIYVSVCVTADLHMPIVLAARFSFQGTGVMDALRDSDVQN
jgi:hypothetical protein